MDKTILLSKIESLDRCISRIIKKKPDTLEELKADLDRQDIIVLNVERAVQICVDIAAVIIAELDVRTPTKMAESFSLLAMEGVIKEETKDRMSKAVGFRNLAVHEYEEIDWAVVFSIITERLDDFRQYAKEIMDFGCQ